MKRFPLLVLAVVVLAAGASLLYAGPPKEWKPPAWKVVKDQYDIIKALDPATGMVSIHHAGGRDQQNRDVKVSAFTEVMVDGKKSTIVSMKAGMHVHYTLGGDGETLAHIENVAEQAPAPTPVATATPSFPNATKR